jgi:hypothetical protein
MRATLPRLGTICAVTTVVPDVAAIAAAYSEYFGYRVVAEGYVGAATANGWGAPAAAGRRYVTMAPGSGEPVFLRFVENETSKGWRALTTHGWNATEIVVQDVDALASRIEGSSDFRIIGAPKGLTRFPMIRAMQVIGPAGECLYFTQVGPGSGLDLAPALAFVGRVFIVVAGGPNLDAMFACYAGFSNVIDPPVSTPVDVISRANGLPDGTLHPHGLVKLPQGTLIELDGYPPCTRPRVAGPDDLPPGMAIVSFAAPRGAAPPTAGPPCAALLPGPPRAAQSFRGAAGEIIEFVEEDLE